MNASPKEMVGYTVNRGIDEYAEAFGKNRNTLLAWLKGKDRVLDIGSGGGLLKKETDILKKQGEFDSEVKIIPLDIIYATDSGLEFAKYATHISFKDLKTTPCKTRTSEIAKTF